MEVPPFSVAARTKASVCATHLLGLRVRIPSEKWMSLSCECCVLLGRGLYHSSRGVLVSVVCQMSVIVKPPPPRKGRPWLGIGSKRHKKKRKKQKDYVRSTCTYLHFEYKSCRITHAVECVAPDSNGISHSPTHIPDHWIKFFVRRVYSDSISPIIPIPFSGFLSGSFIMFCPASPLSLCFLHNSF
jgi:hypothetical protein